MEGTRLSETVQKRAERVDALRLQGQTRRMRGAWTLEGRQVERGGVSVQVNLSARISRMSGLFLDGPPCLDTLSGRLWQLSAHLTLDADVR